MTRIDFHSNVPDPLSYVCRLVRKAYGAGQQVVVHGEPAQLSRLDGQLWSFSALDFLPHCGLDSKLAAQTPIVLAAAFDEAPHYDVLINLSHAAPPQFARFARLIEVVGNDDDARQAARERFKFYRERGYPLNHHDVGGA